MKISITDYGYKTKEECNGGMVTLDLSEESSHKDITPEEFMKLVGEDGYSFSGGIFNGGRKQINWVEQELFALDFDNKEDKLSITPDEVIERCKLYKIEPFGIYRTLGSKTPTDKFRVLFRHETIIKDSKVANYIFNMFYWMFPEIDTSCIDISRLFYGGKETIYNYYDKSFNIINLNLSIKTILEINESIPEYQKHMSTKCENATIKPTANKEVSKEDKENSDRMFEYEDESYIVIFTKPILPTTADFGNNKYKPKDGKEFFGNQNYKKLKSALESIKKPDGNTGLKYEMWRDILWGINNTYGEPAWNLSHIWSLKEKPSRTEEGSKPGPRKVWDEFKTGLEKSPNIGTVYNIAREYFNWKYKEDVIVEFNKRFFVSRLGSKTLIFNKGINPTNNQPQLINQNKKNFFEMYDNIKVKIEKKTYGISEDVEVPAVKYWWNDKNRRTYAGGVWFDPANKLPKNCYNMWLGYKYEDVNFKLPKQEDSKIETYLDHIYRNICSSDDKIYDYIINWMAKAIQKPEIKAPVAIVIRSDLEGVGKGVFVNSFGELFGESYISISNPKQIVGEFNAQLQKCILLFSDEAQYNKSHYSILKNVITEESVNINPKGVDAFQASSYLHFIMSSNSDFVVPAAIGARRFCILDVLSTNANDIKYFTKMRKQLEAGGYKELFHFLKSIDITNFNIYDFPKTEALNKQKTHGLCNEDKFILERLKDDIFDEERGTWDWITSDMLGELYRETMTQTFGTGKYKATNQAMGLVLKKIFGSSPLWKKKQITKNIQNKYNSGTKTLWVTKYYLPPIDDSRKLFEKYVGFSIPWENIEIENNPNILTDKKNKRNVLDFNKYSI